MTRQIQDDNLLLWEVYPSAGDYGFSRKPYLVFHCVTAPTEPSRRYRLEGDEADGEKLVATATDAELTELMRKAQHFH